MNYEQIVKLFLSLLHIGFSEVVMLREQCVFNLQYFDVRLSADVTFVANRTIRMCSLFEWTTLETVRQKTFATFLLGL